MTMQNVRLMDGSRKFLAMTQVTDERDHYEGSVDLQALPSGLRKLFDEFEEMVNGQVFSVLDEIQGKISSIGIRAVFENGDEMPVDDVQIYPSTGEISFKLVEVPASSLK